jgi:hypothetical protein
MRRRGAKLDDIAAEFGNLREAPDIFAQLWRSPLIVIY